MLFKDFEETFFSACEESHNSAGELAQKHMALTNHLLPFFGAMELCAIGPADIRRYKNDKASENYSKKTINNHLNILSRYLAVAREEKALQAPKWTIKLMALDAPESRFLSVKETERLIRAASEEENAQWAQMIVLGIHTGLRVSELLGLDWKDINLNGMVRTITVAKSRCRVTGLLKRPKNGLKREVAMTESAAAVFKSMDHRSGLIFDVTYQGAYSAMKRITERAGLDHVGWHTLRHTFASHLVTSNKVALLTVSKLLGHQSLRMTERYAHLSHERNKDAMVALEEALSG